MLRASLARAMSSTSPRSTMLMTPHQLNALLSTPSSTVVLDGSWLMPNAPSTPQADFQNSRLPTARFFDVDKVATKHELGLSHMLPSAEIFANALGGMGIRKEDHVVVYDSKGIFSAPRTAMTFKAFGHEKVSVLDGGLPRWIAEGYPTADSSSRHDTITPCTYPLPTRSSSVQITEYDDLLAHDPARVIFDARPAGRFTGSDPEPREGLSSGHMPHSLSLPFSSLLAQSSTEPSYTSLLPREALEAVFIERLGKEKWEEVLAGKLRIVNSCGSGMTAGILWLALSECGVKQSSVYDESWTGWALRANAGGKGQIIKD